MGKYTKGAHGAYSGKVGSLVGSSWKDISYIKTLPKKRTKPFSAKQLDQQLRFRTALRFLKPITALLNATFVAFSKSKLTGYNVAMQHLIFRALRGTSPNYEIDYSKVLISDGPIAEADGQVVAESNRQIRVTWDPEPNDFNADETDLFKMLIYDPSRNFFKAFSPAVTRAAGEAIVNVSQSQVGRTYHVFYYFATQDGKRYSPSTYAGEIIIE